MYKYNLGDVLSYLLYWTAKKNFFSATQKNYYGDNAALELIDSAGAESIITIVQAHQSFFR